MASYLQRAFCHVRQRWQGSTRLAHSLQTVVVAKETPVSQEEEISLSACAGACSTPCAAHPWALSEDAEPIDYTADMRESSKSYQSHWLLCGLGRATEWPSAAKDTVMGGVTEKLKASEDVKMVLHACDRPLHESKEDRGRPNATHLDLIKLPEFLLYPQVPAADPIGGIASIEKPIFLHGTGLRYLVLICGHAAKDKRCGEIGPRLRDVFLRHFADKGLNGASEVHLCSHVGGHKYAGNVILYKVEPSEEGESKATVSGRWFGRVQECHVPTLIDRFLLEDKIVTELHRGGGCRKAIEW